MFCTKCGTKNAEGAQFCVKCGERFASATMQPMVQGENLFIEYFKSIFKFVSNPSKFIKEGKNLESNSKSFTFWGITSGLMMIVGFLFTLIREGIYTFRYNAGKTAISKLFGDVYHFGENIGWLKETLVNLLVYAGIVAATAGVICLVGVIFKKKVNFRRYLSLASLIVIPYAIGNLAISQLFYEFSYYLGSLFAYAGTTYSILLFVLVINRELDLKDNYQVFGSAIAIFIMFFAFSTYGLIENKIETSIENAKNSVNSIYDYLK